MNPPTARRRARVSTSEGDEAGRLAQVERLIAAVRVAVVLSYGAWLATQTERVSYPAVAWVLVVTAILYSGVVIIGRRWFYGTQEGAWALTICDACLSLGVIATTGAARSPTVSVMFLVVITLAMRFDIRRAVLLSLVVAAVYSTIVVFVPSPDLAGDVRLEAAVWWPFYFLLTAVLTGTLSRFAEYDHRLRVQAETVAQRERQRVLHLEALDHEREREREQTLRVVVHEFRTPIASLRALARHLDGGDRPDAMPASAVRATRLIQEHADHLADMCDALRDAISGDGLDAFERGTSCDAPLAVLVEAAVAAAAVGPSGVCVEIDPPDAIVSLDPTRVRRVITNLVENALRHNPAEGPAVTVRGTVRGDEVVLVVSDHGPGLSDGQVATALRKGTQLGAASGTEGLGLWVVDRLVERMGGLLELRNPAGGGLEVVVSLPALSLR
jgi:signal transduction histidine kinase